MFYHLYYHCYVILTTMIPRSKHPHCIFSPLPVCLRRSKVRFTRASKRQRIESPRVLHVISWLYVLMAKTSLNPPTAPAYDISMNHNSQLGKLFDMT